MTVNSHIPEIDPLRDRVLGKIKQGEARMKPRWRFAAASATLALAVVFFAGLLVGFTGLSVFLVRESGAWVAASFGPSGWLSFLRSIPAWHIAVFVTLTFILERLLRLYGAVYRRPLIGSFIAVFALAVLGGAAVEPLHREAARYMRGSNIPQILAVPYGVATRVSLAPDLFDGVVVEMHDDAIVIEREASAEEDKKDEMVANVTAADASRRDGEQTKKDEVRAVGTSSDKWRDDDAHTQKQAASDKTEMMPPSGGESQGKEIVKQKERDVRGHDDNRRDSEEGSDEQNKDAEKEKPQRTRKVRVVITPETRLPSDSAAFEVGETVIIQGRQTAEDTIEAWGVRDFHR